MKKTIVKRLFVSIVLALGATALSAQTQWSYDVHDHTNHMVVFFKLMQGGVELNLDNYEVAAFIGNECRGVATKESAKISDELSITYGIIQVGGTDEEENNNAVVTFKAYDKTTYKVINIATDTDITLALNTWVGSVSDLVQFKFKLKGDVNGDDQIDSQDALLVLQHVAKKITLTANQIEVGDMNGDGKITEHDASLILQTIVGEN